MNIRPTTLHKAKTAATKIVVYDTSQKKAVLLFKSQKLCIKYLFGHLIFCVADQSRFLYLIKKGVSKKAIEDENVFAKPLTYRLILGGELDEKLGDNDYVVLDENFRNKEYDRKHDNRGQVYEGSYELENILRVGDLVELMYGTKKGYCTDILDIKDKKNCTSGTKYYTLDIDGIRHDYKANVLKLITL